MITIATCSNPAEAMLIKSLLEANELEVYVPDELTSQTAVHYSGSGIHVQVDDEDADAARRILAEAETADDDESAKDQSG
jgi:hypothetical protein